MPRPLQVELPNDLEIVVTRTFEAPRALVWDCHTEPELVRRWMLGPDGWSMPVCEMDPRPGGAYRWRWKNDADGSEFGFVGEFIEVDAPSRIVHTQRFDGSEDDPGLRVTLLFEEHGGRTTLKATLRFPSKAARDGAVDTGMTEGMETSYARLDGTAASRRRGARLRKIAFVTYPVEDVARARRFYEETLGLTAGLTGHQGDGWWVEYDLPGGGCLAITNFQGTPSAKAGGTVAFEVDDLDALRAELEAEGVRFFGDVVAGPNCRMAFCEDPEGNALVLHQLTPKD